jgi:hypothetical protein
LDIIRVKPKNEPKLLLRISHKGVLEIDGNPTQLGGAVKPLGRDVGTRVAVI